jgi:predicted helicase
MDSITTTDFLDSWAIRVSKISDSLTGQINSIRLKDKNCNIAFLNFLKALTEIYPTLEIMDCVHMTSESIIIGPIQKILFDNITNKFDANLHSFEEKVIETLRPYNITTPADELQELYDFIKTKSSLIERQQLVKEIYDGFYKQALPNRVARHKKIFGF